MYPLRVTLSLPVEISIIELRSQNSSSAYPPVAHPTSSSLWPKIKYLLAHLIQYLGYLVAGTISTGVSSWRSGCIGPGISMNKIRIE